MRTLELLSPARDAETAIAAIDHGADAVYMGASSHGARSAAANSIDDIRRVAEYAHQYGARLYVTVNTIIYDDETSKVERLVHDLYRAGADALIVQDMALLRMELPPIALHASTQCDTRTPEKAKFLADCGFSQIVLARELTLKEIAAVHKATDIPLEVFVHGALCVSYSGDCHASCVATGRSANRGECAQMCRLSYDLANGDGNILSKGKHLLSLRDMNRLSYLSDMADAGVSSFKIEGRLKDAGYVKNVTAAYSMALDAIVAANPGKYRRASHGHASITFTPDVTKSFNRGFTDYFLCGPRPERPISSPDTPKSTGVPVGTVKGSGKGYITVDTTEALHNGDGLCYMTACGTFHGFRVNRVEGNRVFPASTEHIPAGAMLMRNSDAEWEAMLRGKTAERRIDIDMRLGLTEQGRITLGVRDGYGNEAITVSDTAITPEQAQKPQTEVRMAAMAKLGDTIFRLRSLEDTIPGGTFIAASALTQLRRKAIEAFVRARKATHRHDYRRTENKEAAVPESSRLDYHSNVANQLAETFYREHGASHIEYALETGMPRNGDITVMTTRHCIRREMGACLKEGGGNTAKGPLYLIRGKSRWRLDFDCKECRMKVIATGRG